MVITIARFLSLWALSLTYNLFKKGLQEVGERISIVVPAFNEEKTMAECIESLLCLNYDNFEVILVDDGSKDKTLDIARSYEDSRVKVFHQENRGKAEALNTGIRNAKGKIIVTVDADTRLHPDALYHISRHFTGRASLGAVAGNVKVSNTEGFLQRLQAVEYTSGINLVRKAQSVLGSVMIVPGPIAALRRDAVEKVGFIPTDTFAEDFDITMGILKAGYRVEYEDRAIAYTIVPNSIDDLFKQRRRWYRGLMQVLAKYRDMFLRTRHGVVGLYGVPYMWFDAVSSIINLFLIILVLFVGYLTGEWVTSLFGILTFWGLQTLIIMTAIVLDPERRLWQIIMSPLLLFYNTFLDGVRVAAFAEEIIAIKMRWEKPKR